MRYDKKEGYLHFKILWYSYKKLFAMYIEITNPSVINSLVKKLNLTDGAKVNRLVVLVRKVKDKTAEYITTHRDILWSFKEASHTEQSKQALSERMKKDLKNARSTNVRITPDECTEVYDGIVDINLDE